MSKLFTTEELASEILLWFKRDIPESVVNALTIILTHYVKTGEWRDGMETLLGETPNPILRIQRERLEDPSFVRRLYEQ